jgi:hypothetical protein
MTTPASRYATSGPELEFPWTAANPGLAGAPRPGTLEEEPKPFEE